MKDENRLI